MYHHGTDEIECENNALFNLQPDRVAVAYVDKVYYFNIFRQLTHSNSHSYYHY